MDGMSKPQTLLLVLASYGRASPSLTIFASFGVLLVFTRLLTGLMKMKQQNTTDPAEKKVPILPYWLPYIGHAPSFAWSFDDLLAWGRLAAILVKIVNA